MTFPKWTVTPELIYEILQAAFSIGGLGRMTQTAASAALGQPTIQRCPWINIWNFAGCLFHWRTQKDDSDSSKYSLRPADYPALPLYFYDPKDAAQHTALLNKVFWYVFWDVAGCQSIDMMACYNTARIDDITTTKFPPVPALLTGPAFNECPKISKTLIAYLESLLALTPYQSARDTSLDGPSSANF